MSRLGECSLLDRGDHDPVELLVEGETVTNHNESDIIVIPPESG